MFTDTLTEINFFSQEYHSQILVKNLLKDKNPALQLESRPSKSTNQLFTCNFF